jgi:peptidoglycan/xylan/chitin deacetylase (PgdA/CDA1 family)
MSDSRDISTGKRPAATHRWRPAPAIRLSAAVHLGGVAAVAVNPTSWPYVGAALLANHAALGLAGMIPRSSVLGPNLVRLPHAAAARGEIALTFDDGPDPQVTPAVLDLLDRYGAKATFFCIARKAALCPDIVREIARRGHGVENHSNTHPFGFATYGPNRLQEEIAAAQDTLAALSGKAPVFFRSPMGLRNPFLDPTLARLGLVYVSWTRRGFDTVDGRAERVLSRLGAKLARGDVILLHDGDAYRSRAGTVASTAVLAALLELVQGMGFKPVTLRAACREARA